LRKDVREFIRRLEATGLTIEPTPGHYRVLRDGKPLRKANGTPFTLLFSPDTIRWRRAAIVELPKLGVDVWHRSQKCRSPPTLRSPGFDGDTFSPPPAPVKPEGAWTAPISRRRLVLGAFIADS
jgi:hypothetical protein